MKLINLDTGAEHIANESIEFISFDAEGRGEGLHDKPQVGFACVVDHSPTFVCYGWLTTPIVEVISDLEFKTLNTHYKIEL